jgi:tetratricopeptide (TPR) repeat protein
LHDLSLCHDKIAESQLAQGKTNEALDSYLASLEIADRLAKADSDNFDWQRDLAVSHWTIAGVYRDHDQPNEALKSFRRAREINLQLTQRRPNDKQPADDLAWLDEQISALEKLMITKH